MNKMSANHEEARAEVDIVAAKAKIRTHRPSLNGVSIKGVKKDKDKNSVIVRNSIYKSNYKFVFRLQKSMCLNTNL